MAAQGKAAFHINLIVSRKEELNNQFWVIRRWFRVMKIEAQIVIKNRQMTTSEM